MISRRTRQKPRLAGRQQELAELLSQFEEMTTGHLRVALVAGEPGKGELTMFTEYPHITDPLVHTYSIVARDSHTGQIGVAVQSHHFSVRSAVPWAEAGVGAVATQAFANIDYGPEGLALMRQGRNAAQALEILLQQDEEREIRQVALVDAQGRANSSPGSSRTAA